MFDGPDFPKSLDEQLFNLWLENGRLARIGYNFLVVVWDQYDSAYKPFYVQTRSEIESHKGSEMERFIAAYDLYSESRIL